MYSGAASSWGPRFVRRFLGAVAVILFGLVGHQIAQEPSATGMSDSSTTITALQTDPSGWVDEAAASSVTAVAHAVGSGNLDLGTYEQTRHDPWSGFEISTLCLLFAVVLMVAMVVLPRRALLRWWLQSAPRTQAMPPPPCGSTTSALVALSISRT